MNFLRWSHEKINEQIVHAEAQVPCSVARIFVISGLCTVDVKILIFVFHSADIFFNFILALHPAHLLTDHWFIRMKQSSLRKHFCYSQSLRLNSKRCSQYLEDQYLGNSCVTFFSFVDWFEAVCASHRPITFTADHLPVWKRRNKRHASYRPSVRVSISTLDDRMFAFLFLCVLAVYTRRKWKMCHEKIFVNIIFWECQKKYYSTIECQELQMLAVYVCVYVFVIPPFQSFGVFLYSVSILMRQVCAAECHN